MAEYELSDADVGFLRGQVRESIRRSRRKSAQLAAKIGEAYDPRRAEEREEFLRALYRKLGGDPDRISERGGR